MSTIIDLTQRPPRSPRVQLGGYVLLPRVLDKCRATVAGTAGEFRSGPETMDRHFFNFTGIDYAAFRAEVATGKGDGEMLAWVQTRVKHQPWEIAQWSEYHLRRGPDSDAETLELFAHEVAQWSLTREDVKTWFDLLDLDDHCTFGGPA